MVLRRPFVALWLAVLVAGCPGVAPPSEGEGEAGEGEGDVGEGEGEGDTGEGEGDVGEGEGEGDPGDTAPLCLSPGFGVGVLQRRTADTPASLAPVADTILVVDSMPASLPLVRGIISFGFATSASQTVASAAQAAVPVVVLRDPAAQAAVLAQEGQRVVLQTHGEQQFFCDPRVIDADPIAPAALSAVLAAKVRPDVIAPAAGRQDERLLDLDDLDDADVRHVGEVALDAARLRRHLPTNSRPGAVLPFDVVRDLAAGGLGVDIAATLAGLGDPLDRAEARTALPGLQDRMRNTSVPIALRAELLNALQARFSTTTTALVFEVSTNATDATFSPHSGRAAPHGCLADDLDDDDDGPSACGDGDDEHGAIAAILDAWAGIYDVDALLLRQDRGVVEADLAVALAVREAPSGSTEVNGVAVIQRGNFGFTSIDLAAQRGSADVAIAGSDVPEETFVIPFDGITSVEVRRFSSLTNGETVLQNADGNGGEYAVLTQLLVGLLEAWDGEPDLRVRFRVVDGVFVVDEARPLIKPSIDGVVPVVLLPPTRPLCVDEGEQSDVFALHRLKGRLSASFAPDVVDGDPVLTTWTTIVPVDGAVVERTFAFAGDVDLGIGDGSGQRLEHTIDNGNGSLSWYVEVFPGGLTSSPFVEIGANSGLIARYDDPVVGFDNTDGVGFGLRTEEQARLHVCGLDDGSIPGETPVQIELQSEDGTVVVDSHFFWAPSPISNDIIVKTAPLLRWDHTTITGLTTTPMTLSSPWSQTYRPAHHNFGAHLLYEPRLDSELSTAQKDELAGQDIVWILVEGGLGDDAVSVISAEGTVTRL